MSKLFNRIKNFRYNELILFAIISILAFIVRLYKINNPIADWHSWRQADTASVSRTYMDYGINLLFPRYQDISTTQTGLFNPKGYRFVEFPVYNAIHVVLLRLFPFFSLEVWGRLLSILCSLISGLMLYLIGKRVIGRWGGLLSAFFYFFLPFNIYFTRVILPEPMAVMFGLVSVYLFIRFTDTGKAVDLFLSAIAFALALLIKPFTFFYGIPLIYLAIKKYDFPKIFKNYKLLIALDIALIPLFLWRIWINKYPEGIPHFWWVFNGDNIRFKPSFWRWIFGVRLGDMILGNLALVPFFLGLLNYKRGKAFIQMFLLGALIYVSLVATANVRHDYYQTLVIPAIALALAQGTIYLWKTKVFNKWLSRIVLIFCLVIGLLNSAAQIREFYKINHPEIIEAGKMVDMITPKDSLVIAPYNGDTAFLYQTKRWGWPVVDRPINELIDKGADYYVSVNFDSQTNEFIKMFKTLERNPSFVILDLHQRI